MVVVTGIVCIMLVSHGTVKSHNTGVELGRGEMTSSILEVGDLVFCELAFYNLDPGWDHVAMYIGDNSVIEATLGGDGVVRYNTLSNMSSYMKAMCFGSVATANTSQQQAAVEFARSQIGKPYQYLDLLQPGINRLKDPDTNASAWYCSELVWAAYYNQGINIDMRGTLQGAVMPSEICWDDDVQMHTKHRLNSWYPGMYVSWGLYQIIHFPILIMWLSLPWHMEHLALS